MVSPAVRCVLLVMAVTASSATPADDHPRFREQDRVQYSSVPPIIEEDNAEEDNSSGNTPGPKTSDIGGSSYNHVEGDGVDASGVPGERNSSLINAEEDEPSFEYPRIVYEVIRDSIHHLCAAVRICKDYKLPSYLTEDYVHLIEGLNISQVTGLINQVDIDSNFISFSFDDPVTDGLMLVRQLLIHLKRLEEPGVVQQLVRAGSHTFSLLTAIAHTYADSISTALDKVDKDYLWKQLEMLIENIFEDFRVAYNDDARHIIAKFTYAIDRTSRKANVLELWNQLVKQFEPDFLD